MNQEKSRIAQKGPYEVELQKGKTYAWCRCGLSDRQPFCDASHKQTSFKPESIRAITDKKVYLCGCKQTKKAPYCDGTHRGL